MSPDGALFVGDWSTGIVYRIANAETAKVSAANATT
jgi:hypothetical protein